MLAIHNARTHSLLGNHDLLSPAPPVVRVSPDRPGVAPKESGVRGHEGGTCDTNARMRYMVFYKRNLSFFPYY